MRASFRASIQNRPLPLNAEAVNAGFDANQLVAPAVQAWFDEAGFIEQEALNNAVEGSDS